MTCYQFMSDKNTSFHTEIYSFRLTLVIRHHLSAGIDRNTEVPLENLNNYNHGSA